MRTVKFFKDNLFSILVIVFALVLPFILQIPIFSSVNDLLLDQLQGQSSARREIVVVKIDDESLASIGSWPWDRSVFADAINKISAQSPSVIGFDVLFLESRSGDNQLIESINNSKNPIVFGSKLVD